MNPGWLSGAASNPAVHFDMLDGPMPRGVLGLGDPNVHEIDGRWSLFLGGFSTSFRNRLYRAELVDEATGPCGRWRLVTDARGRASPLAADPPRRAWDAGGMHTPSYVGPAAGNGARIYYTGRASSAHYGPRSRYAIGVLEYEDGVWRRRSEPVLVGEAPRHSVLEPRVVHADGKYRLWYQANEHEIGPGELPDYEIRCTESVDGIDGWSTPRVFSDRVEGFFDNALTSDGQRWIMILARGSNLHAEREFPPQGLWWSTCRTPSLDRRDWSPPQRLADTDAPDTPVWAARGTYGPGIAAVAPGRAAVLFTATRATPRWWRLAARRAARGRIPPVPAPFYLAVGSLELDHQARSTLETGLDRPEDGHAPQR